MTTPFDRFRALAEGATALTDWPGYFVTPDGCVFSTIPWRGQDIRQLLAHPDGYGYLSVSLPRDGKRVSVKVHRLVALTFLGPPPSPVHEVRHLNGNQLDNRVSNLAWGTKKDNADDRERHGRTAYGERNGFVRLTEEKVREIRALAAQGLSQRTIARKIGTHQTNVGDIINQKGWAHIQ